MTTDSWVVASLGVENVNNALIEAGRRRLQNTLGTKGSNQFSDLDLRFLANALELRVFNELHGQSAEDLQVAAEEAFQIARVLPLAQTPIEAAQQLVRLGCIGILGERTSDVKRLLLEQGIPALSFDSENWGQRVWATVLDVWLRLLRKNGWEDLDAIQRGVARLRSDQSHSEPPFLSDVEKRSDAGPVWELVSSYHLAKAAEILGTYHSQGSIDGHYDVREQLEAQFDRAISAANRGGLMERELLAQLLFHTAQTLVDNSIWTVTRAVNSRVTTFVESLVSRERQQPIFDMLPPQRRSLREKGLLGSGHRSVVVSLPTSSGKTLIAQFRILQALNQFENENGWVAYLAPTRALVNQLTLRLRRDFAELGIVVEKVSPALEVDGLEADMILERNTSRQFRILVTTPEKLDLMVRGGWEQRIERPLTLVVVDEAHGLGTGPRGLKLELLLATINREARYAQFLLLTPFVPNAKEIAHWLAPDSHQSIELGVDWVPNDRVIAIAQPKKTEIKNDYRIELLTQHTTRNTISVPESLEMQDTHALGLNWSDVSGSPNKLASATAQVLQKRGTVIVLVNQPRYSWGVANAFKVDENYLSAADRDDLSHIQRFLVDEMGPDFPLASLLDYGVGVHHAGLSDDTRTLMEWLAEKDKLKVLVATTTLAQGVNFPVSGVVLASHQYPYGQDMPPEDFWNISGRAGRIDQGDIGIIALSGNNPKKVAKLQQYMSRTVEELNSTLVEMVSKVEEEGRLLELQTLTWQPGWSEFLQYLAHTYRLTGDHDRFAAEVEQVLRGTLGFQSLRRIRRGWADTLVSGVYRYAERIRGKPLKLVDATGFSWESVSTTLAQLNRQGVTSEVWTPDLFGTKRNDLRRMVGVLLEVPELRTNLREVTGGSQGDGDSLSRIICDWVQGRPLSEMAEDYFGPSAGEGSSTPRDLDPVDAMTKCCQRVFGRLTQTAAWGLAALQSLTVGDSFDSLPPEQQRTLRNLPARVYYGVNSDAALALRILGVPRTAATPLSQHLRVNPTEPLHEARIKIREAGVDTWRAALGNRGASYHRVWSILEGEA